MPTGYQIKDQSAAYYLTIQVVNWIDIFTRKEYKDILIESLKFCQKEKYLEIFGYVVMSNHLHLIVRSGIDDLSGTLRDFKKYTSKHLLRAVKRAIHTYNKQSQWTGLMKNAMEEDFSWSKSAQKYRHLYDQLIKRKD